MSKYICEFYISVRYPKQNGQAIKVLSIYAKLITHILVTQVAFK